MITLVIDSATEACSVALFDGAELIAGTHAMLGRGHAEQLVPMIAALPTTIVVDHMGLVKTPRHLKERVDQITFISGGLKQLAKNIDCPVIALSQLSRQVEYRDDKRPQLSDLRDSGSIEQDADSVLGVYREDYYVQKGMWKPPKGDEDIPPAPPYELEVRVLKNRHGSEGTVKLWCDMAHNVIQDMQL